MVLNILDFAERAPLNTVLTIIHPLCPNTPIKVYHALIRNNENLKTKLMQS